MLKLKKLEQTQVDVAKRLLGKYPDLPFDTYLCHVPAYQGERYFGDDGWVNEYWGAFTKEQKGYEMSDKRFPIVFPQDLEAAIAEESDEAVQFDYFKAIKELEAAINEAEKK